MKKITLFLLIAAALMPMLLPACSQGSQEETAQTPDSAATPIRQKCPQRTKRSSTLFMTIS